MNDPHTSTTQRFTQLGQFLNEVNMENNDWMTVMIVMASGRCAWLLWKDMARCQPQPQHASSLGRSFFLKVAFVFRSVLSTKHSQPNSWDFVRICSNPIRMVETLILGLQFHGSRQVPRHGKIKKRIWWIHIGIDMIDIGLMVTVLCVTFVNFWNAKPELTLSVKPGERRSARWSPTSFGDFLSFLRKYQHVSSCSSFCLNSRWSSEEETDDTTNSPIHPGLDFQPWFTMRKLRRWRELRLLSLQLLECFRLQGSSL